jgi:hypothetical protein
MKKHTYSTVYDFVTILFMSIRFEEDMFSDSICFIHTFCEHMLGTLHPAK